MIPHLQCYMESGMKTLVIETNILDLKVFICRNFSKVFNKLGSVEKHLEKCMKISKS